MLTIKDMTVHFDLQNVNFLASLRTKVMPLLGYVGLEQK